jgi:nicotinate-nucleotide adenylyltransferase
VLESLFAASTDLEYLVEGFGGARIMKAGCGGKSDLAVKRLGIFGGTFNPIHLGHIHIARSAVSLFGLSSVQFVVATTPPHKSSRTLISMTHRYAMVCLATDSFPLFVPSLVELAPPPSPYSMHTVAKIARKNAGDNAVLYFIAGGDSLLDVRHWFESERLLNCCNFIFVMRPGMKPAAPLKVLPRSAASRVRDLVGLGSSQLRKRIREEEKSGENLIFAVDLGALDIAATRIRSLASAGRNISHLVPSSVNSYIQKLHLYGE